MSISFLFKEDPIGSWKMYLMREDGSVHCLCKGEHAIHTTKEEAESCLGANRLKRRAIQAEAILLMNK